MTGESDESAGQQWLPRRDLLKYGASTGVLSGFSGCQSPATPIEELHFRNFEEEEENPENNEEITPDGDGDGVLAGTSLKLGILTPMSHPIGRGGWNGAQLAADTINERGGILGAGVEVVLGNSDVSPVTAAEEHNRLTTQENCEATFGLFLGTALMQTMPSIANQERIHITTMSADPRPGQLVSKTDPLGDTDEHNSYDLYKYHFRSNPPNIVELADVMLEFMEINAENYGWERIAIINEELGEFDDYHERLPGILGDIVDVRMVERPGGVTNWAPIFDQIEDEDCDLALIGFALEGSSIVNQWANEERQFEMGGIHVQSQSFNYWEETDGNTEYVWTMGAFTETALTTDHTEEFIENYQNEFDTIPIYSAPTTYDAILLYAKAIENVVEEESLEELPDSDTMIPYLEDITFRGGAIHDEYEFTPPDAQYAHEPNFTSMVELGIPVFQQWQDDPDYREGYGTMHCIGPDQHASSEYQVPEWVE